MVSDLWQVADVAVTKGNGLAARDFDLTRVECHFLFCELAERSGKRPLIERGPDRCGGARVQTVEGPPILIENGANRLLAGFPRQRTGGWRCSGQRSVYRLLFIRGHGVRRDGVNGWSR